jgi:hypothetical protein
VDGILGHNLLLSRASFHNFIYQEASFANFLFIHDGILAITKCFSRTFSFFSMEFWLSRSPFYERFLFSQWNSGYHEALFTNFFLFFFFSRWNSGYHEASFTNFLFFYDGILAITKPLSRTFSFFTMEFWLSRSLFHKLSLFSRWNSRNTQFGGRLLYTYIIKSVYIGSASLKTLPLDLEPLCKEKSTVLLILIQLGKEKLMFFSRSHL